MAQWNPATYLQFADERSRPFFDLTARVGAQHPARVVDLGCGPGQLTASLATRWPNAEILGLDSSPEMIEVAEQHRSGKVTFELADLAHWQPVEPIDVIISNATLQWVPSHLDLLPQLVNHLAPEGWLAFQVPGNFDAPSHALLHTLADDPRFAAATAARERTSSHDAETYLSRLAGLGCEVDAWETSYLHVLNGHDPVFKWISGTGARPILQALSGAQRSQFEAEYKAQLRTAYPEQAFGTVLPFRRIFVVAHRVAP